MRVFASLLACGITIWGCSDRSAAATMPGDNKARAAAISACPLYVIAKSLVYPAPSATDVPRRAGIVIVSGVSTHARVTLQSAHGRLIIAGASVPVPTPLPVPNRPSLSTNNVAFKLGRLRASESYRVFVQERPLSAALARCPNNAPEVLGTFTTR